MNKALLCVHLCCRSHPFPLECVSLFIATEIPYMLLKKKISDTMLMSLGLVASRVLCKQDDVPCVSKNVEMKT